jgi:hypothetical protein
MWTRYQCLRYHFHDGQLPSVVQPFFSATKLGSVCLERVCRCGGALLHLEEIAMSVGWRPGAKLGKPRGGCRLFPKSSKVDEGH